VQALSDDDDSQAAFVEVESECVPARARRAKPMMTAAEAKAQALHEGLVLVISSVSRTGYAHVVYDGRGKTSVGRYAAYQSGTRCKGSLLGCFATAEEAALAYARHVNNRVPLTVHGRGHSQGALDGLKQGRNTVGVCQMPGCAALVDYISAIKAARRCGRTTFAAGDGCARCADFRRPGRIQKGQLAMAAALLSGERRLIAWPAAVPPKKKSRSRKEPVVLGEEAVRTAAAAAAAALCLGHTGGAEQGGAEAVEVVPLEVGGQPQYDEEGAE